MDTKQKLWPKLALLAATLIWGSSFVMVKSTVDLLPPNLLLAIRFTTAALLLALLFCKRWKGFTKDYLWAGAIVGFCLFLYYCTQTIGITQTTPGKNALLTAVYCVLVPFLYWITDRARPTLGNCAAALLCMGGIGFVSLTEGFSIETGDLFTLVGGFFYAVHMVAVAKLSRRRDPILLTILQFAFAALFSWIATLCFESFPAVFPMETVGSLLYLAVGCTAVALLLQTVGQKYTSPAAASILLSLESVFGVAFSVLLYGEALTPRLVLGFGLIFVAVVLSETGDLLLARLRKKSRPL